MTPRSPIFWLGGKGNMRAKIVPILESMPHTRYVEPFGGGASILLAKNPNLEAVIDKQQRHIYKLFGQDMD